MDKLKTYFAEVVMRKVSVDVIQQIITAVTGYLVVNQNMLTPLGITTFTWGKWPYPDNPPSGLVTLVEWSTLGVGGAALLFAGFGLAYTVLSHHAVATVTGAPQSGDKRLTPSPNIVGGQRKEDQLHELDQPQVKR